MKTLVIGDVHNLIDIIDAIVTKYGHLYDEIAIVGDYWDSFGDNLKITLRTTLWLKDKIKDPKFKLILGNHCLHYRYFRNQFIRGTGYSRNKADLINNNMIREEWDKLLFFYETQGFIISHAGIGEHLAHPILGLDKKYLKATLLGDSKNLLPHGIVSPFFTVGAARGGWEGTKGGITWLDWEQEFQPIEGMNQIVGHSHGETIRYKNYNGSINVNVDCLPYYVLEIDCGKLKEIKLNFEGIDDIPVR
jgi:hypothetical protein